MGTSINGSAHETTNVRHAYLRVRCTRPIMGRYKVGCRMYFYALNC